MDYVADRYSAIIFYFFPDTETRKLLDSIPNLIPIELKENSYTSFKKLGVDVVLHVDGDSNSYVDAYKAFLASSALKAPLVTSPNVAYSELEHGKDLFIVDKIQSFVASLDKAKDISIREKMIKNIRKKTYLYFLDQVVLDKFTLFLNQHHEDNLSEVQGILSVEQLDANSSVAIHAGEYITQTFTPTTSSFNAIQFFGNVTSNHESDLKFVLKKGDTILIEKSLSNFQLKNGLNTLILEDVQESLGQEFSFTLYGDVPIFEIDYINVVLGVGTFSRNGMPKKACLKFKVLQNAVSS